jgi:hypothetical protein
MRSRLYALSSALSLLFLLTSLNGSSAGSCDPDPVDVFCDGDADCAPGKVCNVLQFCVDAFVEVHPDRDTYLVGERVRFTVDPNGLSIEIGGPGGVAPWTIERWSGHTAGWVPLRTGTQYGCRITGCVSGVPVELCIDPGPAWCHEQDAPFTDSWDSTYWVGSEEPCGSGTVTILRHVPAGPGSYRVVYRYGHDREPGRTSSGTCAPQTESTTVPFGIR